MRNRTPQLSAMLFAAAAVAAMLLPGAVAQAELTVADSLEWMTADCELIVRGSAEKLTEPSHEGNVRITVRAVYKGEFDRPALHLNVRWLDEVFGPASRPKDTSDLLLFLKRADEGASPADCGWRLRDASHGLINLAAPGQRIVNADFIVLTEAPAILARVQQRVRLLAAEAHTWSDSESESLTPRGPLRVDVPASTAAFGKLFRGSAVHLHVPADARYRDMAIALAESDSRWDRARGAEMLRWYPGERSRSALTALLSDENFSVDYAEDGSISTMRYYIRETAAESLTQLGLAPAEPLLTRTPTFDESVQPILDRVRRHINECYLDRPDTSLRTTATNWRLPIQRGDGVWLVKLPTIFVNAPGSQLPAVLQVEMRSGRISVPGDAADAFAASVD